jgi:predicted small lipoprotein YifL
MKKLVQQLLAACVVLSMAGCTTIQPLTVDPSRLSSTLKRGDQVQLVTSRGEQLNLKIDGVDASGLQGGGQRIAYNDIQSISRKQVDTQRTMWVVLGVVAAGAVAAAAGGGGGGSGY